MRYCLGPPSALGNLWAALAFMPFGLFFDFMDGKVARWRKKSSLMGQELDSLADLVRLIFFFFLGLPIFIHTVVPVYPTSRPRSRFDTQPRRQSRDPDN